MLTEDHAGWTRTSSTYRSTSSREAMREVLPYVDVFFLSHPEETTQLAGAGTEREAIESLTGIYPSITQTRTNLV